MLVLNEKTTLINAQTLVVGKLKESRVIGRYAVVKLMSGRSFVCKIWSRSFLHNSCCVLDPIVECVSPQSLLASSADDKTNLVDERLNEEDIEVVPDIGLIKSLSLMVVFKTPLDRLKWANNEEGLIDSVRELLKLFILRSDVIVHVNLLEEFKIFGIHLIKVLSVSPNGFGRVIKSTKVKMSSNVSYSTYQQLHCVPIVKKVYFIDSYEEIKNVFSNRIRAMAKNERASEKCLFLQQILLIGSGGCGKSTLLSQVCYDCKVVFLSLDVSELLLINYEDRKSFFRTKIKLAKVLAGESESGLCLVLIKRVENFKSKNGKLLLYLRSFLEEISQERSIVVAGTTESPHSLHPSLRTANKFSVEIYLSNPSEEARLSILKDLCSKFALPENHLKYLAQNTPGFVISDIFLLIKKVSKILSVKNSKSHDEVFHVLKTCMKAIQPSSSRSALGLVLPSAHNVNQIGGLEDVKNKLLQVIVWPILNGDCLRRMNIPLPSGILLYGPPGCGKTSLVRAVASSCKTTFLSVSAADLYSPFVGDAEKTITQLFQQARASAPTVLFIDEIDALVGSRTFREKGVQERILSSFLTELDGVGFKKCFELSFNENFIPIVVVVAATNRPQSIDSALLRPGRFDKLIYVPPPNEGERLDILEKCSIKLSIDSSVNLVALAKITEYYSGADLINLCQEAGLHAITVNGTEVEAINQEHFYHALSNLRPSLSKGQTEWYSDFKFG